MPRKKAGTDTKDFRIVLEKLSLMVEQNKRYLLHKKQEGSFSVLQEMKKRLF